MKIESLNEIEKKNNHFKGNLYFFYSFDIGDDIDTKSIQIKNLGSTPPKKSIFYKTYSKPILLDLESISLSEYCKEASIYNFGAISLRYQLPFHCSLENLKKIINQEYDKTEKNSFKDAHIIFNEIKNNITEGRCFNHYHSYVLIQIDAQDDLSSYAFKEEYANDIVSLLRFEIETLSEHKKNEILNDAFGYYRGDLFIIDVNSAIIYDEEYSDILDIFEYANIKQTELQFFDKALDKQLKFSYDRKSYKVPFRAYFPIIGMFTFDPIGELAKLRVDISVVCERLWSSIKFSDEPYYLEIYSMLDKKLGFETWQKSIDKKLEVISHILEIHQQKITDIRHDLLNLLIILLIFLETLLAMIHYFKT
jgi:hypothetical protein